LNHQAHQAHQEPDARIDRIARAAVDAGLKVHQSLGPGLLESAYEHCLMFELIQRGWRVERQVGMPISYGSMTLDVGYRLDLLVEDLVIIEIKAVDSLAPIHRAQLFTYLKLSGVKVGLLMNFNVRLFKDGVVRIAM
jgi:GxxExxY protein